MASNIVIVGEIAEVIRAQGNPTATGLSIDSSSDSPVISGIYKRIPQIQVGIMPHSDFAENVSSYIMDTGIPASGKHPWNSVGAVGLDAIFTPYSTHTESGRAGPWLPHFTAPSGSGSPNSITLNPFNIFNSLSRVTPTGNNITNDPWMDSGHNISFALNYNPYDSGVDGSGGFVGSTGLYPNGNGSPVDINFEKDHFARHTVETQGIRGVGLRSPIILSGPGYDTAGNPVPGTSGVPHPEAAWNTSLWKTGPVDLRWDESRGVWTGMGSVEIMSFRIDRPQENIGGTSAGCNAVLVTVTDIGYTTTSVKVGDTGITVFDENLCFLNLPISVISGLKGTAQAFKNIYQGTVPDSCIGSGIVNSPYRWKITGLCCGEEVTNG